MTAVCECGPDLVAEGRDGVCLRCRRLVAFDAFDGGLSCLVVLALGFMALVCAGVALWAWLG